MRAWMIAAAALAMATPASARTVEIRLNGLDLSRPEAVSELHETIRGAARRACARNTRQTLQEFAEWKRCVEAATDDAIAKANVPALTAHHAAQKQKSGAG